MSDPYFRSGPDGLTPLPQSHAPWSTDMLHGRLLGGLAARALEAEFGGSGRRVARLTVDLFRPAAMAPVQIETRTVRSGRKIALADATAICDGHEVGRITGLFLAEGDEPPGRIWRPERTVWPDPETLPGPEQLDESAADAQQAGWLIRVADGGMGTGERTRMWTNDTAPLVDDEPMSPLVRAAVSGDIACPISNSSTEGIHYINADYTMYLARYPVGPWVGLEVAQQVDSTGIAIASATMVDVEGPFATSSGSSISRPPLESG